MAKNVNKVTLVGRLGKDPEMRYIPSGKAVCSASMATSRSWKNAAGEWQEETQWHSLELWGDAAEAFNSKCKSGDLVYVDGSIKYEQWESEGVKHSRTKINVDTWIWLAPKGTKNSNGAQPEAEGTEIPILPE